MSDDVICPECASPIEDPAARVCPRCGIWLSAAAQPRTVLRPPPAAISGVRPAIAREPGFDPATPEFSSVTELDLEPDVVPFEPAVSTVDAPLARDEPPRTLPPLARRGDTPPELQAAPSSELPTDAAVRVVTPSAPARAHHPAATVESPLRAFVDGRTGEVAPPLVQYYVLSKRHEASGDVDGAIACLEEALELAEDPALYNRLGILFSRGKGDHARAVELFTRAVELAPGDPVYAKNLRRAERQRTREAEPPPSAAPSSSAPRRGSRGPSRGGGRTR